MKKLVFICGIIAAGLVLFAFKTSAYQPAAVEKKEGVKTIVMQPSWKPGFSLQVAPSGPQWTLVQLGGDTDEDPDEIVSPASQACLICHEFTFQNLSYLTVDYVDGWGQPVNPHVYVDTNRGMTHANNAHNGKLIVPDCTRCHVAHSMPAPTAAQLAVKGKLTFCYSCHHEENWEACSDCH